VKKLAIIATRGEHNALVTILTMVMAAAVCEIPVRIFLRDEALFKLSKKNVGRMNLSSVYAGVESDIQKNLKGANLDDLQKVIRDVKSQGDVKLFACTSSMAICGVSSEDLIPEIDEPRGLTSFLLEEMEEADTILTF
jgi:peroxiredoxin family protein